MSVVNETLVRDVVAEVLSRLNGGGAPTRQTTFAPAASCGCNGQRTNSAPAVRGRFGVFQDANEACEAAQTAFLQLQKTGVEARRKIVDLVKRMAEANADA